MTMPREQGDRPALNPALLKLRLLAEGVDAPAIAPGAFAEIEFGDGTIARARITPASPLHWTGNNGRGEIRLGSGSGLAARLMLSGSEPQDAAHEGAPRDIVEVRGRYATVALGGGCGVSDAGRTCALCLGRELTEKAGEWWSPAEVVDALRTALSTTSADFVHFNVGYLPGDSAGVERLRDYIAAVRHYFDAMICVTMHPPADLSAIDFTYFVGVDTVCYSLEAPDRASMERFFPGRARFLGRQRYMTALAHAARIFPRGATWSVILGDLAPVEVTREAVLELTAMGVVPLLAFAERSGAPDPAGLAPVGALMFERLHRHTASMHWSSGMPTAFTPLDARHLVSGAPALPALIEQLNRNRLGAFATRMLARVRRRLRVRTTEAFDSSEL